MYRAVLFYRTAKLVRPKSLHLSLQRRTHVSSFSRFINSTACTRCNQNCSHTKLQTVFQFQLNCVLLGPYPIALSHYIRLSTRQWICQQKYYSNRVASVLYYNCHYSFLLDRRSREYYLSKLLVLSNRLLCIWAWYESIFFTFFAHSFRQHT